jgi:acetolactate synthase-1/2/3 large subunit
VVLALPEDMLVTKADVADTRRYQPVQASPSAAQIDLLRAMLAESKKPIVLLGGGTWNAQACADLQRFAEANALPVGCTFRFQDLLDNEHPTTWATSVSASIPSWPRASRKPTSLSRSARAWAR